jgi:hypothetical protein
VGYWTGVGQVLIGEGKAVVNTVVGVGSMIAHPINTFNGVVQAASHPINTGKAIAASVAAKAESGLEGQGEVFGDVLLIVAGGGGVVKSVSKLATVAKMGRAAKVAGGLGDVGVAGTKVAEGLAGAGAVGADVAEGTAAAGDSVALLADGAGTAGELGGDAAAALPPLRLAYIAEVEALKATAVQLSVAGNTAEEVARALSQMRRAIGVKYKALTPPTELAKIYARNLALYGDELGPTVEFLRAQGKTWEEIIETASRTGGGDLGLAKPK